ncbi:MAG: LysM peptidoglycan-binding domain-containing protein, partial [Anaerolineae bacterium]|nr:LysM peptidoglycan-binding domain-containing protein [Anaerolineae bacterium]
MLKKMLVVLVVAFGLVGFAALIGWYRNRNTTVEDAVIQGADGPADVTLQLSGPSSLPLPAADDFPLVEIRFSGDKDIDALAVNVMVEPLHLRMQDTDAETDGIQAAPAGFSEGVEIVRNEMTPDGVLHFEVRGLGMTGVYSENLVSFLVDPVSAGSGVISVTRILATAPDGLELKVGYPEALQISVLGGGPTQQPTVQPTAPSSTSDTPTPTPQAGGMTIDPGIYYRIQPGQTLYRLGKVFGCSHDAIAQASSISDVHHIPVGTLLRIPVASPMGQAVYLVAPHDTLYSIARTFGMTVETLAG